MSQSSTPPTAQKKYILAIDSGSTGIRALLFNKQGEIVARSYKTTPMTVPEEGAVEHDPEMLWQTLLDVVKEVFQSPDYDLAEVASIGITNQRGSFCLVDKATGKPLTNFIGWADFRANEVAKRMDHQFNFGALRAVAGIVGNLTGSPMMLTTNMLRMKPVLGVTRLRWLFEQEEVRFHDTVHSGSELYQMCKRDEIHFMTLDTWFIYKLTGGKQHLTDVTNASGTALYNPFDLVWNKIYFNLFKIPNSPSMFPKVLDTAGDFGTTDPGVFFGNSIQIGSGVGDHIASLFGHCCFTPGDTKISHGSGAF
ncbi:MAG: glycerol kinase, partial [Promethearchaeota archaeon]